MDTKRRTGAAALALGTALAVLALPAGAADDDGTVVRDTFERRLPSETSPSGQSVMDDCAGALDEGGWMDATADLRLRQVGSSSDVTVRVRDARPHTYYTVWLRFGGTSSDGQQFGFNPVNGGRATALAHTDTLPYLLSTTGPGNGSDEQPNGFWTDDDGDGTLRTTVDFPIVGGAYPFQRWEGFDPDHPNMPIDDAAIHPVAIAGPQGPYTLRIVSHCTDGVGHGLRSGPREWWFDWTVDR